MVASGSVEIRNNTIISLSNGQQGERAMIMMFFSREDKADDEQAEDSETEGSLGVEGSFSAKQ